MVLVLQVLWSITPKLSSAVCCFCVRLIVVSFESAVIAPVIATPSLPLRCPVGNDNFVHAQHVVSAGTY